MNKLKELYVQGVYRIDNAGIMQLNLSKFDASRNPKIINSLWIALPS